MNGDEDALVNGTTPACANSGSVAVLLVGTAAKNRAIGDNLTTDVFRSGNRSQCGSRDSQSHSPEPLQILVNGGSD